MDPLETPLKEKWKNIGTHHHHGIDLPLSALHSKNSCGIGEFYNLIPLIDWCKSLGMDVIQLLPLNDTGDDTCPFFAVSSIALNPLFLSLHKLEGVDESQLKELQNMNLLYRVPYHDVQSHKLHFLRDYFEKVGPQIVGNKKFEVFTGENPWIETYGLFKVLKDHMSKNDWRSWPKELQYLNQKQLQKEIEANFMEVCFYIFLQYLCHEQLTDVKRYANEKGVFLKGDIPILISPDSADVWEYSNEFDLNLSAGAPPGPYSKEGQVWGLPIFKWDVMKERNYDWWRKRLSYAGHFYDIYRIDHILGFFRIYAIEQGKKATEGFYIPEKEEDWIIQGKEILTALCNFTHMLPIGEDLGVVPDSVRAAMNEIGIPGTKVLRWEKITDGQEKFIDPSHYNPVSMSTVSTHDSETLSQWWKLEEAKSYAKYKGWEYEPELSNAHRKEILYDSHHSASVFHINLLGEYLALFPELVWEDPDNERINVPGTLSEKNWTYRFRPSVEEIVNHKPLKEEIQKLL